MSAPPKPRVGPPEVDPTPTNLEQQLERLPDRPGVYIFRDASGRPIYIGKALSLRNRVRSHFHAGRSFDNRTIEMYNRVVDIDYIATRSEMEALILESNLVKEHQPEYNIRLKDDKSFPYLRVDLAQAYPRVEVVRRMQRDGARYFGPYTRPGSLRETLRTLRKVFPFRTCTDHRMRTAKRPCLDFQIRRCLGPCAGAVTPEEYRAMMEEVCLFLEGRRSSLEARLKQRMDEAAADLKFERAAEFRDKLKAVRDVMEKQVIVSPTLEDLDAVGYARSREHGLATVSVFHMREGKIVDRTGFTFTDAGALPGPEVIAAFLKQHYGQTTAFIPARVLVPEELPEGEKGPIEEWLSSVRGRRVIVQHPLRGQRRQLTDLANQNAAILLKEEEVRRQTGAEQAYARAVALGEVLGLPAVPERIEGYDISNIHGLEAVGSMVVFLEGRPAPGAYRRFRVRGGDAPDDYAMMQEVLYRRFRRLREGGGGDTYQAEAADFAEQPATAAEALDRFGPAPDLVLIDGGKGHLAAALEVLEDLELDLPVLALAKEKEEVFLPGRSEPLDLPETSPALHLLRHVRDEAHRFAVGYHRLLRRKRARRSELDGIPGVGPVRRTALLRVFGSAERIRAASVEELAAVPEVGEAAARRIWEHLRGKKEGAARADRATAGGAGTGGAEAAAPDPGPEKSRSPRADPGPEKSRSPRAEPGPGKAPAPRTGKGRKHGGKSQRG